MEKVKPDKYYSLREVQKLAGIKSRQYLSKYVEEGFLQAIEAGEGKNKRYLVRGDWVLSFIDRYSKGLVKKFSIEEVKSVLKMALKFCEENNITTLNELINQSK